MNQKERGMGFQYRLLLVAVIRESSEHVMREHVFLGETETSTTGIPSERCKASLEAAPYAN